MSAPVYFAAGLVDGALSLVFNDEETSPRYAQAGESGGADGREVEGGVGGCALEPEDVAGWAEVHARILSLAAERAGIERELCRWLLAAERLEVARRAGYSSLREYADRVVGLNGRQTEERLRVGRLLAVMPALDRALASGELGWSVVRELSRVATAETEQEWIAWAKGRRSREVEQAVATRERGERPRDRAHPELVRHRLSFEVRPETMALFRDLEARVRADLIGGAEPGVRVDDDLLLFEIARRALGGPADHGRSSYQVAVTRCGDCGRTSFDGGGEEHAVDEAVAEMVSCDTQEVGEVTGHTASRAAALAGPEGPHEGADASPTPRPAPISQREPGSPHEGANTIPTQRPAITSKRRARQTIPPATRRQVMRRDGKCCVVPGCQNHIFLDVHHLDPLSEGGDHDPERMVVVCGSHHRAAHRGTLCIDGTASGGFSFRHADGTPYGWPLRPARVELAETVFATLRKLGFGHRRARALVNGVLEKGAPNELDAFVREALGRS